MRNVICQCISDVTLRRGMSIIDRQMMNSVTEFLSFDFADPVPYRFNRSLRIHLGDIISPRCLLTVSDISASLSNAIQVTLGWFTFEPLKGPVVLFDCTFTSFGKPWFIETFLYCRSLRNSLLCNVLQDGSEQRHGIISIRNGRLVQTGAAQMLKLCPICLRQLSSLNPFKRRWTTILPKKWKVVTTTRIRTNSPGEIKIK